MTSSSGRLVKPAAAVEFDETRSNNTPPLKHLKHKLNEREKELERQKVASINSQAEAESAKQACQRYKLRMKKAEASCNASIEETKQWSAQAATLKAQLGKLLQENATQKAQLQTSLEERESIKVLLLQTNNEYLSQKAQVQMYLKELQQTRKECSNLQSAYSIKCDECNTWVNMIKSMQSALQQQELQQQRQQQAQSKQQPEATSGRGPAKCEQQQQSRAQQMPPKQPPVEKASQKRQHSRDDDGESKKRRKQGHPQEQEPQNEQRRQPHDQGPCPVFPDPAAAPPQLDESISVAQLKKFLEQAGAGNLIVSGLEKSEILELARKRYGGWECRRLLACKDLKDRVKSVRAVFRNLLGSDDIKQVFKELRFAVHPDKNYDDHQIATQAFQFLQDAYTEVWRHTG